MMPCIDSLGLSSSDLYVPPILSATVRLDTRQSIDEKTLESEHLDEEVGNDRKHIEEPEHRHNVFRHIPQSHINESSLFQ